MKKRFLGILCCVAMLLLVGCTPKENVDYSAYDFAGVEWKRDTECDIETLRFLPNGDFSYSCGCGNPVNDADAVESYSYDEKTKTFTLNCIEELEGMVTQIKLISCDGQRLELDFDGEIRVFGNGASGDIPTAEIAGSYNVDLTKMSPLIRDFVGNDVINAAQKVIKAFLQYENEVEIEVSGNEQRFMNDMAYVIHCTCPVFEAFADFDEMTAYDAKTGKVSWSYHVNKDEFDSKLQSFYEIVGQSLSKVEKADSDVMRAMILYYEVTNDLQYDEELIGEKFDLLTKKEADLRSSSYYVLVEKSGICTNIAQAYMFLCTQADITCGTVLHTGGSGMHMWNMVQMDGIFYYCDPTWDANTSFKYFGMTMEDRASWAGGYSAEEGIMLSVTIPDRYDMVDDRFATLRSKLPIELSELKVDKDKQVITFVGYEYEYEFSCK